MLTPITLAFNDYTGKDIIKNSTFLWELLFDIFFLINVILNFITAYQHDLEWITVPKDIAKKYLKSLFLFDIVSTLPCLIMRENSMSYWFKLLRFVHFGKFLQLMNMNLKRLFYKCGLDKQLIERIFYFIT